MYEKKALYLFTNLKMILSILQSLIINSQIVQIDSLRYWYKLVQYISYIFNK